MFLTLSIICPTANSKTTTSLHFKKVWILSQPLGNPILAWWPPSLKPSADAYVSKISFKIAHSLKNDLNTAENGYLKRFWIPCNRSPPQGRNQSLEAFIHLTKQLVLYHKQPRTPHNSISSAERRSLKRTAKQSKNCNQSSRHRLSHCNFQQWILQEGGFEAIIR